MIAPLPTAATLLAAALAATVAAPAAPAGTSATPDTTFATLPLDATVEGRGYPELAEACCRWAYRQRDGMRQPLVHMDDVGPSLPHELPERANASDVELVAEWQTGEGDALRARLPFEGLARPAHDGDVMTALAQAFGGLEHLVHRTGVETIELEDLENPHQVSS
jgi:hypothetical protein